MEEKKLIHIDFPSRNHLREAQDMIRKLHDALDGLIKDIYTNEAVRSCKDDHDPLGIALRVRDEAKKFLPPEPPDVA